MPPQVSTVIIQTELGGIDVAEFDGAVELSTGGGEIQLGKIGGTVQCYSGGGQVVIERAGGAIDCTTVGGNMVGARRAVVRWRSPIKWAAIFASKRPRAKCGRIRRKG